MVHRWFKAKRYGWGWTPASKAGWILTLVLAVYIGLATSAYGYIMERIANQTNLSLVLSLLFIGSIIVVLGLFLVITSLTGDRPHWQWGGKQDE